MTDGPGEEGEDPDGEEAIFGLASETGRSHY